MKGHRICLIVCLLLCFTQLPTHMPCAIHNRVILLCLYDWTCVLLWYDYDELMHPFYSHLRSFWLLLRKKKGDGRHHAQGTRVEKRLRNNMRDMWDTISYIFKYHFVLAYAYKINDCLKFGRFCRYCGSADPHKYSCTCWATVVLMVSCSHGRNKFVDLYEKL